MRAPDLQADAPQGPLGGSQTLPSQVQVLGRGEDQPTWIPSTQVLIAPSAAAIHLSLIVLFLFYVRFFIIFLLFFMSVLTVVFFSLTIDLIVMFV